jgi:cell division protein ZapA (FtsZ GTPase activity inhibitor)
MTVTVDITVGARHYAVACTESEASRIAELGKNLNEKFLALQAQVNSAQVSDTHIMVLLNLMMQDELAEAKKTTVATAAVPVMPEPANDAEQQLLVKAVEHLTSRVISIADRLKAA